MTLVEFLIPVFVLILPVHYICSNVSPFCFSCVLESPSWVAPLFLSSSPFVASLVGSGAKGWSPESVEMTTKQFLKGNMSRMEAWMKLISPSANEA